MASEEKTLRIVQELRSDWAPVGTQTVHVQLSTPACTDACTNVEWRREMRRRERVSRVITAAKPLRRVRKRQHTRGAQTGEVQTGESDSEESEYEPEESNMEESNAEEHKPMEYEPDEPMAVQPCQEE